MAKMLQTKTIHRILWAGLESLTSILKDPRPDNSHDSLLDITQWAACLLTLQARWDVTVSVKEQ